MAQLGSVWLMPENETPLLPVNHRPRSGSASPASSRRLLPPLDLVDRWTTADPREAEREYEASLAAREL